MSVVSFVGPPGLLTGGLTDAATGRFVRTQLTTQNADGSTVTLPGETVDMIRAFEMREEYGTYDNALLEAVRAGKEHDVSILLKMGASPNFATTADPPIPVLYIAAARGYERVCDVLLAAGANVNGGDTTDTSPLVAASYRGHINTVNNLIAAGARINFPNGSYPDSPLCTAAENNHLDVVRALIAAGADVNYQNMLQDNILNWILSFWEPGITFRDPPDPDVINELIQHGADVNYRRPNTGDTPLMNAACVGNPVIVRMLLDHGADPRARNVDGYDAVRMSQETMRGIDNLWPRQAEQYREIFRMIRNA